MPIESSHILQTKNFIIPTHAPFTESGNLQNVLGICDKGAITIGVSLSGDRKTAGSIMVVS